VKYRLQRARFTNLRENELLTDEDPESQQMGMIEAGSSINDDEDEQEEPSLDDTPRTMDPDLKELYHLEDYPPYSSSY